MYMVRIILQAVTYFAYISFEFHMLFNAKIHQVFYCSSHHPHFLQSSNLVFYQQTFLPLFFEIAC